MVYHKRIIIRVLESYLGVKLSPENVELHKMDERFNATVKLEEDIKYITYYTMIDLLQIPLNSKITFFYDKPWWNFKKKIEGFTIN